jgi:hypothetical protein
MGEAHSTQLSFTFNGSVRVEARGEKLTADAGVLALREIDNTFDLIDDLTERLDDPRNPDSITHPFPELLRSRIFALAQGYQDQDDLDLLRDDPAFRLGVSQRRGISPLEKPGEDESVPDGLASQPTHSRLVQALSSDANLRTLNAALFDWAVKDYLAARHRGPVTLDVDSTSVEVHGHQSGSAYSGHYRMRCYHPILTMLSGTDHVLAAELRPGNVHTADGVAEHLLPVIERVREQIGEVAAVRGDAGFPDEDLLSFLEGEEVDYVFRLRANAVLDRMAAPHLHRPPGRPPKEPRVWVHELSYAAGTWSRERRVVLVVMERPGELFLHRFFLVTSYQPDQVFGEDLLEFYRQRGTMEQHLGEIKTVLDPALSCTSRPKSHVRGKPPKKRTLPRDGEKANAATFLLYLLAYNLANTARNLVSEPERDGGCPGFSIKRVRSLLLKVAARLTVSARRATFVVNEARGHLWEILLGRLERVRLQFSTA